MNGVLMVCSPADDNRRRPAGKYHKRVGTSAGHAKPPSHPANAGVRAANAGGNSTVAGRRGATAGGILTTAGGNPTVAGKIPAIAGNLATGNGKNGWKSGKNAKKPLPAPEKGQIATVAGHCSVGPVGRRVEPQARRYTGNATDGTPPGWSSSFSLSGRQTR
jgi:hypothetical protein